MFQHVPKQDEASPYKSVADISYNKLNAPVVSGYKDAKDILQQVRQTRGFLESNLESVLRSRREVEVYSMLETVYNDR